MYKIVFTITYWHPMDWRIGYRPVSPIQYVQLHKKERSVLEHKVTKRLRWDNGEWIT